MRKVESGQQGPHAKERNWMMYWRRIVGLTWWLNVWKRKKTLILSGDFHFRFSAENECLFSFSFRFGRKWNFIFVGIFVFVFVLQNNQQTSSWSITLMVTIFIFVCSWKWKMPFGRPLVYIILVSRCKVLVLVLNTRSWYWKNFKVLVLKKSWLHHCFQLRLTVNTENLIEISPQITMNFQFSC